MKFLNSGSADKAWAGAELGIIHLLSCFAAFIILPFLTDSTAVPPCIPVKGSSENVPGLSRDCTWAELTKGSSCWWGPHCRGVSQRWLGSLAVTFPGSSSSQAELGFLSWNACSKDEVALLQPALEPRSCCKELWLLQRDAFGKDETMTPTKFCFSLLHFKRPPWICGVWACVAVRDGKSLAGQ